MVRAVWFPHQRPCVSVLLLVDAGVDLDVVVLCVMAIQHNGMGVPASPSGVFRLRSAPVPPKSRLDFPPAPLTLAGQCRYRFVPALHTGWFEVLFGRSLPTGRDRPQVHFPESSTGKPGRHVRSCSGEHSAALRDRLQVEYRGTQRKKQGGRAAPHGECRARHFAALRDWP